MISSESDVPLRTPVISNTCECSPFMHGRAGDGDEHGMYRKDDAMTKSTANRANVSGSGGCGGSNIQTGCGGYATLGCLLLLLLLLHATMMSTAKWNARGGLYARAIVGCLPLNFTYIFTLLRHRVCIAPRTGWFESRDFLCILREWRGWRQLTTVKVKTRYAVFTLPSDYYV